MALQSGVNSTLGHHVGRAFAAVVSFATGLAAVALFFAVEVTALGVAPPTLAAAKAAPWWSWLGGPLGAFYVAVVVVFARAVGATTLSGVFVSSLLFWSFVLDSVGVAGFPRRAFSWPRLLGLALMIGGVVLVTMFPGDVLPLKRGAEEEEEDGGIGGRIGRVGSRALLLVEAGRSRIWGTAVGPRPPVARSYSSVVLPRLG
jgi:transporter family-2 protein